MTITIDGEAYEIRRVNNGSYLVNVELEDGTDWYVAEDTESAGQAARKHWQEMKDSDPKEFRCIIGDERLIQWACGESDNFGISGFEEFLDAVERVPEEEFGSYDGTEQDVSAVSEDAAEEIGFTPKVAYRHN